MIPSACCNCYLKYNGTTVYRCAGCNQSCDAAGVPFMWRWADERDKYQAALQKIAKGDAEGETCDACWSSAREIATEALA